jgi:hypothetical protein
MTEKPNPTIEIDAEQLVDNAGHVFVGPARFEGQSREWCVNVFVVREKEFSRLELRSPTKDEWEKQMRAVVTAVLARGNTVLSVFPDRHRMARIANELYPCQETARALEMWSN